MTYTTTQHPFIIDDKHPSDVFDEMANFFSLYTVTLDSLNRMSLQLNVPADFDIDGNQKLHDSYQQFVKAVRYSVPDINVLPINQTHDENQDDRITLMIQTFEGRVTDAIAVAGENSEPKPKFYKKLLGGLLPKFASEATQDGLYPEQVAPVMVMPAPTEPPPAVVTPQAQPQPVPAILPAIQPTTTAPIQLQSMPVKQPVEIPQPQIPSQAKLQPLTTPSATSSVTANQNPMPTAVNLSHPVANTFLPKPSKSIRPYRELLIQAILNQVQNQTKNSQPITRITFKSRDSLTTAFIETVFASFSPSEPSMQGMMGRAGDAIDLASFGLEELRPQLAKIGANLSDDAEFLLNSKTKARADEIALIQQGQLNASVLNLDVQLDYGQNQPTISTSPTPNPLSQVTQPAQTKAGTLNSNRLNIAIHVKVSDSMGERTVKVREFPVVFSNQNSHAPDTKLIKVVSQQLQGELFYLAECDGQLLAQQVMPNIQLQRGGQASPLLENMTLLPNDVISYRQDIQISLLLG